MFPDIGHFLFLRVCSAFVQLNQRRVRLCRDERTEPWSRPFCRSFWVVAAGAVLVVVIVAT